MNVETWVQALPGMITDGIAAILGSDGTTPTPVDIADHQRMVSVTAWSQVWGSTNTAASTSPLTAAVMTTSDITVIGLGRLVACFGDGVFLYLLVPGYDARHARFIVDQNLPAVADLTPASSGATQQATAFPGSPEVTVGVAPTFLPDPARTGRWEWVPTSENWGPSFSLNGRAVLFA